MSAILLSLRWPIIYMTLSALSFTVVNSCVRYLDHLPTFELVFFRSFGSAILALIVLKSRGVPLIGEHHGLLMLRGVVGFISLSLFFRAVQLMPLGSAVSLRYLSPFFAAALALYFLNERMRGIQWLFFMLAFIGVLILKGFDTRISLGALSIVLASSFTSGMVYVIIRKIGKRENPVVVVNYFMVLASLLSGAICLFYWVTPIGIEWLLVGLMGIFGFFAQLFMTKAMQEAESNVITPFKYLEVIFTLIVGWLLFAEYQTVISILAIAVIIFSLLANVLSKRSRAQYISDDQDT